MWVTRLRAWSVQPGSGAIPRIRRPASARRPTTQRWLPPSARNVSTCGAAPPRARMLSARRCTPPPPASSSIKSRGNAFALERCPLGTRAEDWNEARPEHATPNRTPRAESALGALAPATTSIRPGSGHRAAPQTRKPRYSAVSEALCRTRTGDPFLTMAVPPSRESSPDGQIRCTAAHRVTGAGRSDWHLSTPPVPAGYPARTAFHGRGRPFRGPFFAKSKRGESIRGSRRNSASAVSMSGPMVFAPGTEAAAAPRSEHVRLTVRPRRLEPAFQQHATRASLPTSASQCEQTESDMPEPPAARSTHRSPSSWVSSADAAPLALTLGTVVAVSFCSDTCVVPERPRGTRSTELDGGRTALHAPQQREPGRSRALIDKSCA